MAALIPTLESKIHLMRTSTYDLDESNELPIDSDGGLSSTICRNLRIDSLQPLSLGDESIPYADESPDQILIPSVSFKASSDASADKHASKMICVPNAMDLYAKNKDTVDYASSISNSSDDSNESNTSDLMENQTIRISRGMLREMNRILTTLERKATKLNRSLSLNIKYHNSECCPNNVMNSCSNQSIGRLNVNQHASLTKDEKTDKNINKKRQIQDINKNRRPVSRPIKRRHTVGGIHYYGHTKSNFAAANKSADSAINKTHNNDNNENNNHENNRNATYSQ